MTAAPRRSAVALSYADRSQAPVVVAKGYGPTAESIMRVARENDVFVHESAELVSLLMQVDLDRRIPPELYVAVAQVLAWVAWLQEHGAAASSTLSGLLTRPDLQADTLAGTTKRNSRTYANEN